MATRKTPAKKTTARKTTARKTTARKTTARKTTTQRRTTTRRPQPALSTTIGGALGALVVTTLLDLSWPVRIALVVVVLLLGLGYLLWKNRAAITAGASGRGVGSSGAVAPPQVADHPDDPAGPPTAAAPPVRP